MHDQDSLAFDVSKRNAKHFSGSILRCVNKAKKSNVQVEILDGRRARGEPLSCATPIFGGQPKAGVALNLLRKIRRHTCQGMLIHLAISQAFQ